MRQEIGRRLARSARRTWRVSAGYPDPIRLQWAMEARRSPTWRTDSISQTAEGIAVTLAINMLGEPEMAIAKGGKPLKTVPPKQETAAVAALLARKKEIERQGSRMRRSLEQAMCRGDIFTGAENTELLAHPGPHRCCARIH